MYALLGLKFMSGYVNKISRNLRNSWNCWYLLWQYTVGGNYNTIDFKCRLRRKRERGRTFEFPAQNSTSKKNKPLYTRVCSVSVCLSVCLPACLCLCVLVCFCIAAVPVVSVYLSALIRCQLHARVTAVARKRPWSICQKCRWQATSKQAYTLDPRKSDWADYAAVQA